MDPIELLRTPPLSAVIVFLITIAMSTFTGIVTRKVTDQAKLQRYRKEIAEWNRMRTQAAKTGDEKLAIEIRRRSKIIQSMQKQVSSQGLKPMLVFFVPWLVIWTVLSGFFAGRTVAAIPYNLGLVGVIPLFGTLVVGITSSELLSGIVIGGASTYGLTFFGWYLFCSFSFGMMINRILGVRLT